MSSVRIQYIPRTSGDGPHPANVRGIDGSTCVAEYKKPGSLDVLPAYLDLPTATLSAERVRKFLNVQALFNDHLIIPDGWFHCTGPLSEYLRSRLRWARSSPHGETNPEFLRDPLLLYLNAGLIVPALRGDRPARLGDPFIGFDVHDVWAGQVTTASGEKRGYGIAGRSERERMAILDPEENENADILKLIAKHTTKFVDWTSPAIPVGQVGYDSEPDRLALDALFLERVENLVFDSGLSTLTQAGLEQLLKAGGSPSDAVTTVFGFWDELIGRIESDRATIPRGYRRGDVEGAVAGAFGQHRLRSYEPLVRNSFPGDPAIPSVLTKDPRVGLRLKHALARTLLDRVSFAQQSMFAERFDADLGFPARPSIDLIDQNLLHHSGHLCDVDQFESYSEVLWDEPIPFELLEADQVLTLRSDHRAFFEAARAAAPSPWPWTRNRELLLELRRYVEAIARAIPISAKEKSVLIGGRRATAAAGVAWVATPWTSGVEVDGGIAVLTWRAERMLPPLSRWLTAPLDQRVETLFLRWRAARHADVMLQALGISDNVRDMARRGGRQIS